MGSPRCSSTNCEDGTGSKPDKTAWYGSTLVVADRWYPSSKTCSRCKTVKAKLSLSKRTYRCERCGLVTDRDLNAAVNVASLVESPTSIGIASGAGTGRGQLPVNAQGEERFMGSPRCSSTNCEDGSTAPQGQKARHRHPATGGSETRPHRK